MQRSLNRNLYFESTVTKAFLMQETKISDKFVILSPGHNAVNNELITIYERNIGIFQAKIQNFISNTIYLDTPINHNYSTEAEVHKGVINLSTPTNAEELKKFTISSLYDREEPIKIKNIKGFALCSHTDPIEDKKFFNVPELYNGLIIEVQGQTNEIICNIKNNIDLQNYFTINQMTFGDPNFRLISFSYQYEILLENSNLVIHKNDEWDYTKIPELIFFAEIEQV